MSNRLSVRPGLIAEQDIDLGRAMEPLIDCHLARGITIRMDGQSAPDWLHAGDCATVRPHPPQSPSR